MERVCHERESASAVACSLATTGMVSENRKPKARNQGGPETLERWNYETLDSDFGALERWEIRLYGRKYWIGYTLSEPEIWNSGVHSWRSC